MNCPGYIIVRASIHENVCVSNAIKEMTCIVTSAYNDAAENNNMDINRWFLKVVGQKHKSVHFVENNYIFLNNNAGKGVCYTYDICFKGLIVNS